jgi:hypothetical protein
LSGAYCQEFSEVRTQAAHRTLVQTLACFYWPLAAFDEQVDILSDTLL